MTAFTSRLVIAAVFAAFLGAAPSVTAQPTASPRPIAFEERPAPPAEARTAATWQATINHLTRADAVTARVLDRHNARTADFLKDVRRGRIQTLPDYVSDEVMPQGAADIARVIRLFEEAHGAILDYTVQGTVPRTEKAVYTFAEVRFADNTTAVLRMTWKDAALIGMAHAAPLFTTDASATNAAWQPTINWLAAVREGRAAEFDAYNATSGRVLRALKDGNSRPLYRILRADRQQRGTDDVERMLALFEAEHGAIAETVVLGTLPRSGRSAYTFAEVHFANGHKATFRLTWLDGRMTGLVASPPLFSLL